MSHTCCETGGVLEDLTAVSGVTPTGGHDHIVGSPAELVVSSSAIVVIPRPLRRYGEPSAGEHGVNVHRIVPEGGAMWLDDFVFSLSEATTRQYLPNVFATLYGVPTAAA
jgi:hypothetical protein